MKLQIRHFTDTAHILPDTKSLVSKGCARLHGHTYAFIVDLEGKVEQMNGGMLIDFKAIKELIDIIDHKTLIHRDTHETLYQALVAQNPVQVIAFEYIPSSENISRYIAEQIDLSWDFLKSIQVSVCEGYKGQERANWTIYKIEN